jgi:hypothetical protein
VQARSPNAEGAALLTLQHSRRATPRALEEAQAAQANSASTGRKLFEASGIKSEDLSPENMYDGFGLFHVFHIEPTTRASKKAKRSTSSIS